MKTVHTWTNTRAKIPYWEVLRFLRKKNRKGIDVFRVRLPEDSIRMTINREFPTSWYAYASNRSFFSRIPREEVLCCIAHYNRDREFLTRSTAHAMEYGIS